MEQQIQTEINYLQRQMYQAHTRETQSEIHREIERMYGLMMDVTGEYKEIQITQDDDKSEYMCTIGDGTAFVDGVYDGRYGQPQRTCNCAQCMGLANNPNANEFMILNDALVDDLQQLSLPIATNNPTDNLDGFIDNLRQMGLFTSTSIDENTIVDEDTTDSD